MSTGRLIFWSIFWSLPVQYCYFLALQVYWWKTERFADAQFPLPGNFGCSGFFELGITHCTFPEMLGTPLLGILFGNVFLAGLPTLLSAAIVAGVLGAWRSHWSRRGLGVSDVVSKRGGPAA